MQKQKKKVIENFEKIFGKSENIEVFFAPGRINVIGEHVDYCGGKVLPAAIDRGTFSAICASDKKHFSCFSKNENSLINFTLEEISAHHPNFWVRYLMGVLKQLQTKTEIPSCNIYIEGNLPIGSGLSSSASLLLALFWALQHLCKFSYSKDDFENRKQTALACQKIENEFIGLQCGIMDQAAVALAKKDSAMLLDCGSFQLEWLKCDLGEDIFLIVNSNKPRSLADSKYNERRRETDQCLSALQEKMQIANLAAILPEQLEEALSFIPDKTLQKRLTHQVTENHRVRTACKQIAAKDNVGLGKTLQTSHLSLRENYEVTGRELDLIFDYSMQNNRVKGVRMTGAGFTGCALALLAKDEVENYQKKIQEKYHAETGLMLSFFTSSFTGGVQKI
jgi:galactokinase